MKIYIVLDNTNNCYDEGGIYYGAFQTKEDAEEELSKFDKCDRSSFEIMEEDIGDVSIISKLIIALKAQHQPHMDYIPQLDCTVTKLLEEYNND